MMKASSSSFFAFYLTVLLLFSTPSNQQNPDEAPAGGVDLLTTARKLFYDINVKSYAYVPAAIPMRLYECLREFSMLRCTKAYVLKKLEERPDYPHTGNLTRDFLNQFFGNENEMGSLVAGNFENMSDKELNHRLLINFQRFFKQRDIKLHFLPGLVVKVVPSRENKLKFSLRQKTKKPQQLQHNGRSVAKTEEEDNVSVTEELAEDGESKRPGGGTLKKKKAHSYKQTMIQMAVPVMILPAILMGSFLPFILPVLKMATLMTMIMNNGAFLAALLYAARTHANAQEEHAISYGYAGFH